MTTTKPELKECPFCNQSALMYAHGFGNFSIKCGYCECTQGQLNGKSRAIDAWNTRHTAEPKVLEDAATREDVGRVETGGELAIDNIATSSTTEQPVIGDGALAEAKKFALEYWQSKPDIYGPGFKNIPDLAEKIFNKFITRANMKGLVEVTIDRVVDVLLEGFTASNGGHLLAEAEALKRNFPDGLKIIDGGK